MDSKRTRVWGRGPQRVQGRALAFLLLAAAAPTTQTSCADVTAGTDRGYACLNQWIARQVPARPAPGADTLTATSPANAVGTFDQAATKERLGDAFGHSVVPQRPPPAVYNTIPGR